MTAAVTIVHAYAVGALVVILALLVFSVVTLVDTARRPAWQWAQAGVRKSTWVTLEVVFLVLMLLVGFFAIASLVVDVVYFASARPKLVVAERQGPGGTWPNGGQAPYGEQAPYWPGDGGQTAYPGGQRRDLPAFGWYPDPSGRHDQRYWDGTRWTDQVSDDGRQSVDPLPS